ncbi:MAG: hypothetical protein DLM70_00295 [Chloroflexi bacterium]|nr:MAG: hypothetical protein DLM70_00295 [Chloroflexota bacterium]
MDDLGPYDRATVNLWARSYAELSRHTDHGHLFEAAVHAVLVGLRQYHQRASLFAGYETEAAVDLALIRNLLPSQISDEMLWRTRDAAFHLRWVEVAGSA